MEDVNPLGSIFFMTWKNGPTFQTFRVNGDKARLEHFFNVEMNHPKFEIDYHEPLHLVRCNCWTAFVTVTLVPANIEK